MINALNYKFVVSPYSGDPCIQLKIEGTGDELKSKDPFLLQTELNQLFGDQIRHIVQELEEVKTGERESCSFGFETTFINVYKKGYKNELVNFPDGKVYIDYDYLKKSLETHLTIDDILKMMTDWRDYIDTWEQETGKVKK